MAIHIGTNDVSSSTSRVLKLISLFNEKLPQCKVWLSTPTLRTANREATFTVSPVSESSIKS